MYVRVTYSFIFSSISYSSFISNDSGIETNIFNKSVALLLVSSQFILKEITVGSGL